MSEIFQAKLRKIGNSMGIIIPSDVIDVLGFKKGDLVQVALPSSNIENRNKHILDIAGIYKNKASFKRERTDRF